MSHRGVLIIFIGICSGLCFANTNFEITIDRVDCSEINSDIIHIEYAVRKYNRTCKALSSNFTLFKDLGPNAKVEIQGFAMFSNQYRPVPVLLVRSICDILKNEFLWIKSVIVKHGHFPTECQVRAGDYYLKDFIPNGADFPAAANFPWKTVMARMRFFEDDAVFFTVEAYLTLDHDAELKRLG